MVGSPRDFDERALDSVMRAVDLVEDRLGDDIGAEDMARAACYSLFYFSRLFVRATGHTPYDYLMRRRVALAAHDVVEGGRSLTEIALDRGFDVPDTFARAFRRCFGILPSEARKAGSYPRAIARTKIGRRCVEDLLTLAVSPPTRVALVPPPALFAFRELDGEGAAIRSFACRDSKGYPINISQTTAARFALRGSAALESGREYAYRAWLAAEGRGRPPRFELLELEPSKGEPVALLLPLSSAAPLTKINKLII